MIMPVGNRARRAAGISGYLLAVLLLTVNLPRAVFVPAEAVHKSQDSNRPKAPKKIVRVEPIQIVAAEKQGQAAVPDRIEAKAAGFVAGTPGAQPLPRKAFTQLTKPDYLQTFISGSSSIPLCPPA